MAPRFLAIFALFIAMHMASATDPNQLDDFCVATNNPSDAMLVNGQWCKNPSQVTADDFLFRGSDDFFGNSVFVDPTTLPGLNTLGISLFQINASADETPPPPHYHPRATEVFTLLKGSLYAGFVSFNQSNNAAKLYSKTLSPGDVFVFPQGLLHFAVNVGESNAVAIAAFSSQNPGTVMVPAALFKTQPPISVELLSKAFKLDPEIVKGLQSNN